MLPGSFRLPVAIVLVAGGLLSCFAGYRVFRIVLALYGFILGALVASSAMGTDQTFAMVIAAILGGLIGALILIAAYFVGVALIGAGIGALVANVVWAALDAEPGLLAVVLLSIAGALAALAMQRYVIITATAFGGAWTAIVGVLAALDDRAVAATASRNDVWLAYPFNPAPGQRWILAVWLALGLAGLIVQLGVTAKGRK